MARANTHLLYGTTGTFKTSQAGFFARYIWRKYRKPTRLISADPGGYQPLQPLVDAGIIIPVVVAPYVKDKSEPITAVRKFGRGQWPRVVAGKPAWEDTDWDKTPVGGYIVESLYSLADLEMDSLSQHTKAQGSGGEEITVDLTLDGERIASNNRSHYNTIQKEISNFVRAMGVLPVPHVLFTTIEALGEDEDTREPIRGPAIVGKKATPKAPTWVGDCIHMESYPESVEVDVEEGGKKFKSKQLLSTVRAYFTRHPDARMPNVTYPAKPRVPSALIPKLFKRWPGGYFKVEIDRGLDDFLDFEDELEREAGEDVKRFMAEVEQQKA